MREKVAITRIQILGIPKVSARRIWVLAAETLAPICLECFQCIGGQYSWLDTY